MVDATNFVNCDVSSMNGKVEYLEKYSVVPPPSRDYYGLRVLQGEVILNLWKISHGPHKLPIVRSGSFEDFQQNKSLQDEIHRGFGVHLLEHVRNIARGDRNTLLTLPKCLIQRLLKYLTVNDIVKLSSLSHVANEIFNDNSVWEILYKRYKSGKIDAYEKRVAMAQGWKQVFKESQMLCLTNDQKNSRIGSLNKLTRTKPETKELTRPKIYMPKAITKIDSSVSESPKKPLKVPRKSTSQEHLSKRVADIRTSEITLFEGEKSNPKKRTSNIKSLQTISQRNIKLLKEQSIIAKTEQKQEVSVKNVSSGKIMESKSTKTQKSNTSFTNNNISSPSVQTLRSKTNSKSITTLASRMPAKKINTPGTHPPQNQTKTKAKTKTKKACYSKSTILTTDKALLDSTPCRNNSFDLGDLIESSLKNIRSPRSIFDYDFSCLEKACAGDAKVRPEICKNTGASRGIKIIRNNISLDRLSEKSEPLTGKSMDLTEKMDSPNTSSHPSRVRTNKSKRFTVSNKNAWSCKSADDKTQNSERYSAPEKLSTSVVNENLEKKFSSLQRPINRMDILRSLGSNRSDCEANLWNLRNSGQRCESQRVSKDLRNHRRENYN